MRRVDSLLNLDQVDHRELMQVLLGHFGRAERSALATYRYQKMGAPAFLEVEEADDGSINAISVTDDFPDEALAAVRATVKKLLLDEQRAGAGREVLFCRSRMVSGCFQYRNQFVIYPVPPAAPQLSYVYGLHPFIIEFTYVSSPDQIIDWHRRRAIVARVGRYLNVLTNGQISDRQGSVGHGWVLDGDSQPPKSRWMQSGYRIPEMPAATLPLAAPKDCPPLGRVERESYYTDIPGLTTYELTIPDNLEDSLDRIHRLTSPRRRQFDLAAVWHSQSSLIGRASASASYVALVTALEALLDEADPQCCQACGQQKYAVTKRFKTFLREHAPLVDNYPQECDRLYKVRSNIAHGREILEQDVERMLIPNPKADREMQVFWNLHRIVGVAISSWLDSVV